MPGQRHGLNRLEARRQELVLEAEWQRKGLRRDLDLIQDGVHTLGGRAKSLVAAGAVAVAGIFALKQARNVRRNGGSPLFSKLATGARVLSTVWSLLRSRSQ